MDEAKESTMSVCPLCSLLQSETGGRPDAIDRIAAGGMWVDDASGEVEDRVLQGQ
jgi:hypothetical protein